MTCQTVKKAFEDSLKKQDIKNSDQFLTFDSGTIYNVTFGDFVTKLGVTGALQAENGNSATPVLTGTAPDYKIRGISGGVGIQAQVNAQGSITINAQLANAGNQTKGEALIPNTQSNTLAFRRLFAGKGIDITSESDRLIISNSEVAVANKTTIVSQLSDFPTAVSGVITLLDNREYFLTNNISTSSRFVMGENTVISSVDPYIVELTYTGTGSMFTFSNGRAGIKEISISCPNGTLLNSAGVTTGNCLLRWLLINNVKDLGSLSHPVVGIYDWFIQNHTGDGIKFSQVDGRLKTSNVTIARTTKDNASIIDLLNSTYDELDVEGWQILSTEPGQKFITALPGAGNINDGSIGFVSRCTIDGDMQALSGLSSGDAGWDFTDNNKIADTRPVALISLDSPSTTSIGSANTPVVVSGTFNTVKSSIFTTNVNGRVTYEGRRPYSTDITASITFTSASGTNQYTFYVAKNGVVQTESGISKEVSATTSANICLVWDMEIVENDFIEIYVENNSNSSNVEAVTLTCRVR